MVVAALWWWLVIVSFGISVVAAITVRAVQSFGGSIGPDGGDMEWWLIILFTLVFVVA